MRYILVALLASGLSLSAFAQSSEIQSLLTTVKAIQAGDEKVNIEREATFRAALNDQQQRLAASEKRLQAAEAESVRLRALFDQNELALSAEQALLKQRSGQLGEVFGIAKEKANAFLSLSKTSIISSEYPARHRNLAFGGSQRIPTVADLQNLWFEMQLEMSENGQVKRFIAPVTDLSGDTSEVELIRFGAFSAATAEGRYVSWNPEQQALFALPTQPDASAQQGVTDFSAAGLGNILLDPTLGDLFLQLDRVPTLKERIQQGGLVGYLILALGALGLCIGTWQMGRISLISFKVRKQVRQAQLLRSNNPLGRVLAALHTSSLTLEQMEFKLEERVLAELPALEKGQSLIKLLAAVAPLLGLLGTVVGMISTFQSITLFGSGDPKLMASGISQALMTTVLGLVVAIPLLFVHSFLVGKSRRILQILQEKSLGLLSVESISKLDMQVKNAE